MFRIVDNSDGSTSVFSSDDGKLICTLGSRPGIRPEAVGISHPIVRERSSLNATSHVSTLHTKKQIDLIDLTTDEPVCENTSNVSSQTEEIPDDASVITLLSFASCEDQFQEDDIDQSVFLQHLGLISSSKQSDKINDLKSSFPIRKIARVQKDNQPEEVVKDCEEMDICSPLGQMIIKNNNSLLNSQSMKLSVKKCEKYCQFSLVSLHPMFSQMPQLRDRDLSKKYPVTFRPLKTWGVDRAHRYAFNTSQRHENLKILKTGLNKRGRRLKQLCRNISVVLTKLSKEDLQKWKSRRNLPSCSTSNCISVMKEKTVTEVKRQSQRLIRISNFQQKLPPLPECTVLLEDVAEQIAFAGSRLIVKGTNIFISDTEYSSVLPRNLTALKKEHTNTKFIKHVTNKLPPSEVFFTQNDKSSNQQIGYSKVPFTTIKINSNTSHPTQSVQNIGASHYPCLSSANKIIKSESSVKSSKHSKPVTWTISSRNVESETKEGIVKPITLKALHNSPNSNFLSLKTNVNNASASLLSLYDVERTSTDSKFKQTPFHKLIQSSTINHPVQNAVFTSPSARTLSSILADHGSYTSSLCGGDPFESSHLDVAKENVTISAVQVAPFFRRPAAPNAACHDHRNGSFNKIDLTSNISEKCSQHPSFNNLHDGGISHWVFLCFGCGLEVIYSNKSQAMGNINNHLTGFHSVLQPQSFLKSYYAEKHGLVVVEAFPGFKSNKC